jgi:prolyl-tRNA editing enzyme YbaK/EbsC (Cys-tRNA(Pro) deacylase)
MPIPSKTKKYLDTKMAKYDELAHKTVYTAYDAAQTLQKELKDIAKSLLIATDKAYIIAVVPAHMRIDLGKLKKSLKAKKVSIPDEKVMVKIFKVKAGAMTAFGGMHKVEVWADKSLLKTKDIILSAGSFTDSVRMKVKDFLEMEQAKLANFAKSGGYTLQIKKTKNQGNKGTKKPASASLWRGKQKGKKMAKKKPTKRSVKRFKKR